MSDKGYIQVLVAYRGSHTENELIEPGLYAVGDPRLHGLEEYLVGVQGKAQYVLSPAGLVMSSAAPGAAAPDALEVETGFTGEAIRLKDPYRGKLTDNALLVPGIYRVEELPGGVFLAKYLVEIQNKAYWVSPELLAAPATAEIPVEQVVAPVQPLAETVPGSAGEVATETPVEETAALKDYDVMTKEELLAELALYGMDENSITEGTGKDGNVIKVDLIKALREAASS